jgi:hypothetical protein
MGPKQSVQRVVLCLGQIQNPHSGGSSLRSMSDVNLPDSPGVLQKYHYGDDYRKKNGCVKI